MARQGARWEEVAEAVAAPQEKAVGDSGGGRAGEVVMGSLGMAGPRVAVGTEEGRKVAAQRGG